jgi:uncharacterized protein
MNIERRSAGELRAAPEGKQLIAGYASVFSVETDIAGWFREVVLPGAFTRSLADQHDVLGLLDHDRTKLLGRTAAKTLRLTQDERGLAFELDAPPTQLGRDVVALIGRGDIRSASFAFTVQDESWPARDRRELRSVVLHEISVVTTFGAYDDATVALRARELLHPDGGLRRRIRLALI